MTTVSTLNDSRKMNDRKISDKPFCYPSQKQKRSNATAQANASVASHLLLPQRTISVFHKLLIITLLPKKIKNQKHNDKKSIPY
jgi:hypothetical protein